MATLTRRKKIILVCAALGIGGYASYKVLNSQFVSRKRRRVAALMSSLMRLLEAFSAGIDSTSVLAGDLRAFLMSDDDQIPRSLRQSLKIARCREFQDALTVFSSCVTRGVVSSFVPDEQSIRKIPRSKAGSLYHENNEQKVAALRICESPNPNPTTEESSKPRGSSTQKHNTAEKGGEVFDKDQVVAVRSCKQREDLPERLMQKLFSESGTGFASAVLGSVARNTVLSALEGMEKLNRMKKRSSEWDLRGLAPDMCGPSTVEDSNPVLDMACSTRGRALIADCIQAFVGTAVTVYLEKTKDINLYEQMVAGVTKPAHRPAVDQLLTSVFSGAVETFVKTSHQVLSSPPPSAPKPDSAGGEEVKEVRMVNEESDSGLNQASSSESTVEEVQQQQGVSENVIVVTASNRIGVLPNWVEGVSRTLAVPSNRKLLIDVAGTVTSEAIHSFFEVFFGVIGPYLRSNLKLRGTSRSKSRESLSAARAPIIVENSSNGDIISSGRGLVLFSRDLIAKSLVILTVCLAILMHLLVDLPANEKLNG